MATWFARQTANINAANVWNSAPDGSGSWLTWPAADGDILVANGFTLTLNVNVNLGATGQIRTDATGGATAGGRFSNATNGRSLTANIYAGTSICLLTTQSMFVVGDSYGGSVSGAHGVYNNTAGTLTFTGNAYSGSVAGAVGILGVGTLNMTGSGFAAAADAINSNSQTITLTGNLSSTGAGFGLNFVAGSNVVTVTGQIGNNGIRTASTNTFNITGDATAGTAPAITLTSNATVTLSGFAQASDTQPAINNAAQGIVTVGETRSASNGRGAVLGAFRFASAIAAKSLPIIVGSQRTLSVLDVAALVPAVEDVRAGVVYGDGAYTGTLALQRKRQSMAGRF